MTENNEGAFAKAEVERDKTVKEYWGSARTKLEREGASAMTQRATNRLDRAARKLQPPQR